MTDHEQQYDDEQWTPQPYTFDEFRSQMAAMGTVRTYTDVRNHYGEKPFKAHIGTEQSFESTAFRVIDYFAQQYKDRREVAYKASRFMATMQWLVEHTPEFVDTDHVRALDVDPGSDEPDHKISDHLMGAAFELVALGDIRKPPTTEQILSRADELREEEDAN